MIWILNLLPPRFIQKLTLKPSSHNDGIPGQRSAKLPKITWPPPWKLITLVSRPTPSPTTFPCHNALSSAKLLLSAVDKLQWILSVDWFECQYLLNNWRSMDGSGKSGCLRMNLGTLKELEKSSSMGFGVTNKIKLSQFQSSVYIIIIIIMITTTTTIIIIIIIIIAIMIVIIKKNDNDSNNDNSNSNSFLIIIIIMKKINFIKLFLN